MMRYRPSWMTLVTSGNLWFVYSEESAERNKYGIFYEHLYERYWGNEVEWKAAVECARGSTALELITRRCPHQVRLPLILPSSICLPGTNQRLYYTLLLYYLRVTFVNKRFMSIG